MKLALPNKNSQKGFTLIELMIAIAIVAILATVGLTIFTGSQKSARDTKRRSDISAIANAFESHYLPVPGICDQGTVTVTQPSYCPLQSSWFAQNAIPTDPRGTGFSLYCIYSASNSTPIADLNTTSWAPNSKTTCPAGWTAASASPTPVADGTVFNVFKVCAYLETSNAPICVGSQQL